MFRFSEAHYNEALAAYKAEELRSFEILQHNRHSSVPPYVWFGPDPEPEDCGGCPGCEVRKLLGD